MKRYIKIAGPILLIAAVGCLVYLGFPSPFRISEKAYITTPINNARQVILALKTYEGDHGKYPDTLEELVSDGIVTNTKILRYPALTKLPRLSCQLPPDVMSLRWLYIQPTDYDADEAIIIAPLPYFRKADGKIQISRVVGRNDGSVRTVDEEDMPEAWQSVAKRANAPKMLHSTAPTQTEDPGKP